MPAKDSAVCTPPLKRFPSRKHKNIAARYILPLILLQPWLSRSRQLHVFERRVGWAAAYRFSL